MQVNKLVFNLKTIVGLILNFFYKFITLIFKNSKWKWSNKSNRKQEFKLILKNRDDWKREYKLKKGSHWGLNWPPSSCNVNKKKEFNVLEKEILWLDKQHVSPNLHFLITRTNSISPLPFLTNLYTYLYKL